MPESCMENLIVDDLEQRKAVRCICAVALFLLSSIFFIIQVQYPLDWDAAQYMTIATQFNETGMESYKDDVRTYFYPWFLSLNIALSKLINLPARLLLFACQTCMYFFCVNRLATAISRRDKNLGRVILIILSVNIFVIPYLSISLTEGIFLSLFILWLSAFARLEIFMEEGQSCSAIKRELIIIAAVSGMILVTRPAGLWICFTTCVMLFLKWKSLYTLFKPLTLTLTLILSSFAFLVPLMPQIYMNTLIFQEVSPFPVKDLAGFQIQVGIENLKYGTNISGGSAAMWYPNPFLTDKATSSLSYRWYFIYPFKAFLTVLFKFIGAFDFDYLFCYIAHLRPSYRWLTSLTSLSIFIIGLWGTFTYCIKNSSFIGNRSLPLVCLFFWGLVTLPTALELRFSLPMQIIFVIFTAQFLMEYRSYDPKKKIKMAVIYFLLMSVVVPIAYYVSTLNVALKQ